MRDEADNPTSARDLLRAARPSRAMTRDERGRGASRVAKLASLPLAGSAVMLWMKVVAAAAGIGVAGVVAVQIAAPSAPATTTPTSIVASPQRAPFSPHVPVPVPDPVSPPELETETQTKPETKPETAPVAISPRLPAPVSPVPIVPERVVVPIDRKPPTASAPTAFAPTAFAPTSPPVVDELTREAQLVEAARSSLVSDPATTLLRVEEHRHAFPQGQLADERELIAVDALRRLGRATEARSRGEALLRRDQTAGSPGLYGERVRKILATLP
jgi:hypothetical protein